MSETIFESRLTHYKARQDYECFGEALLNAANEGHLVFDSVNNIPAQETLWQLGVGLPMTRDEIIICLSQPVKKTHELLSYLTECTEDIGSIRAQLRHITDSAICFAEQAIPETDPAGTAEIFT